MEKSRGEALPVPANPSSARRASFVNTISAELGPALRRIGNAAVSDLTDVPFMLSPGDVTFNCAVAVASPEAALRTVPSSETSSWPEAPSIDAFSSSASSPSVPGRRVASAATSIVPRELSRRRRAPLTVTVGSSRRSTFNPALSSPLRNRVAQASVCVRSTRAPARATRATRPCNRSRSVNPTVSRSNNRASPHLN